MNEYRCKSCHKLLFIGKIYESEYNDNKLQKIEMKCPKCKVMNEFTWGTRELLSSPN